MSTDVRVAIHQQSMTFWFSHDDDHRIQPVYWITLYSTPSINTVFSTHGLKQLKTEGKKNCQMMQNLIHVDKHG